MLSTIEARSSGCVGWRAGKGSMAIKAKPDYGKCINPMHKQPAKAVNKRGLCSTCYRVASRLVYLKKTTWEQMVNDGMCNKIAKDCVANWFTDKYGSLKKDDGD